MGDDIEFLFYDYINQTLKNTTLSYLFSNLKIHKGSDNLIIVETPNEWVKELIEKNYLNQLIYVIKEIVQNEDIRVELISKKIRNNEGSILTSDINLIQKTKFDNKIDDKIKINKRKIQYHNIINKKYTFEQFIVGENNQLAYNIAYTIAENYNKPIEFNPFILYSPTGLGKSHLVQAIYNYVKEKDNNINILYITSEIFLSEFIDYINKKSSINLDEKYKNIDILIIDDIQFFENKPETQKFLFRIYKNLYEKNKKLIFTLDRPIENLKFITKDLIENLKSGVVADIGYPDFETRMAILRNKSKTIHNIEIPEEILIYIAGITEKENIRVLEGILNKIIFYHKYLNLELNFENVKKLIENQSIISQEEKEKFEEVSYISSTIKILNIVANYFKIDPEEIKSKSRKQELTLIRYITIYLLKNIAGVSKTYIAQTFNKSKGSIDYSIKIIEEKLKLSDPIVTTSIENLEELILNS